ncbi:MAG: dirigent protein [Actinobacteria bacterium]|nr:dirigent protein [Actinomycetota bacterium]
MLLVVPAVAVVTASGNATPAKHTKTIRVANKITSFKMLDAAPKGRSPGDVAVLAGTLRRQGSATVIGRYQGLCTTTHSSNSECTFTWSLAGGQITTITAYGLGFNDETVVNDAIVGGTKAYRDARGEGIGKETSETTGIETLRITLP